MTTSEPDRPLVMVSGCFDLLHSGHVAFLESAAKYGALVVAIGSDHTIAALKGRPPVCGEQERLYLVQSLRMVCSAFVSSGDGLLDFAPELRQVRPAFFVVNEDGDHPAKRALCQEMGVEYIVLKRLPHPGLPRRFSSELRLSATLPYRIEIAGGWLDQPFVSGLHPGPVIVASIEPQADFAMHSGLASSTRTTAQRLWGDQLPAGDPLFIARDLFAIENPPGTTNISGSQDALGLLLPGVTRLDYAGQYWPRSIASIDDEATLRWLESVLYLMPIAARPENFDVLADQRISTFSAQALAQSAEECWTAILACDLHQLGRSLCANLDAQVQMFPAMLPASLQSQLAEVQGASAGVKFTGAGGGGYFLVAADTPPAGALPICIRRTSRHPHS